ncbi:MAG: flagellar biosynthesis protein FlhF [Nevskiaceae bacterium]|nr:MAG: flagellar biosynthesis protein FlhF [Nevskiaceae bacterium]TBR72184.1 MAG: flagellar biosynthesis protein FlhF [Nevskiaceae bacterium]
MKIKRFTGRTMREALRAVRAEQGPDAVILGNNRTTEGVEVVAAVDYDEALLRQALQQPAAAPPTPQPAPIGDAPPDPAFARIERHLNDLQAVVNRQMGAWTEFELRRDPQRAEMLNTLSDLDIEPELARELAGEIPTHGDPSRARCLPLGWLARRLPVVEQRSLDAIRVLALIGPTGVGKTTTLAKLAQRAVRQFGPRNVVLLSLDTYRIGAQEQLSTYARLLGVPLTIVQPEQDLRAVLSTFAGCREIFIDTAGLPANSPRSAAQLQQLHTAGASTLLTLPANARYEDLLAYTRDAALAAPLGAVLTKLDETRRFGTALSAILRQRLPIAWITDGQRVPEDLHVAEASQLVIRAVQMSRRSARPSTPETQAAAEAATR